MRKSFYLLSLLLLFPAIVSAEVKHTVSSSLVVDIAVDDYNKDINCGGLKFWGIQAIEHKTGNRIFGNPRFVSSAVLSQKFTLDLPMGDYEELTFVCSGNGEAEAFQFGSIENNLAGDQVIFVAQRLGATATTSATTITATTASTNQTGIIPSIINGVLDFFGINTGTTTTTTTPPTDAATATSTGETTATSTVAPLTEIVSSTTETVATTSVSSATTTEEVATTTTPQTEETILPSQGEVASSSTATTTQASLKNSFLAAVGLFSLGTNNVFVAIVMAIGIFLLLAFVFYWTAPRKKRTKR